MILSYPDDFRVKIHDFSAPATNCPVLVIEAVPKLKINVFRQLRRADRDILVIFVGSPSMIFRKITISNTVLNTNTKRIGIAIKSIHSL